MKWELLFDFLMFLNSFHIKTQQLQLSILSLKLLNESVKLYLGSAFHTSTAKQSALWNKSNKNVKSASNCARKRR